jgi:hypothetical protein
MCAFIRVLAIISALLTAGLLPMTAAGQEALKFRYITSIYSDDQGVSLKHPEGIACNDDFLLVVADTGNSRLLRYIFKDNAVTRGALEIKALQLSYPTRAQINSRGEIYALDGKSRRIVHLTPEGRFKSYLDLRAPSSAAAPVPRSFYIANNDDIYVLDVFAGRVLELDSAGKFRRQIKLPQGNGFFSDVTVDLRGTVYLIDSINAKVFSMAKGAAVFAPLSKSLKEYVRFPTQLNTDDRGRIYILDRNGGKVTILGQDGSPIGWLSSMGWKEGRLNYPSQLCINRSGEIFIADTLNNRIQIFSRID